MILKKVLYAICCNRIDIINNYNNKYDAVILAVAHNEFKELNIDEISNQNRVVYDIKGIWNKEIVDGRL